MTVTVPSTINNQLKVLQNQLQLLWFQHLFIRQLQLQPN